MIQSTGHPSLVAQGGPCARNPWGPTYHHAFGSVRTGVPAAMGGSRGAVPVPADRDAGQHRPERGAADAGDGSARHLDPVAVDRRRVRDGVCRAPPGRRKPGGPARTEAHVRRWPPCVRRRVGVGGVLGVGEHAVRRPGEHGYRRGADHAVDPVDHHRRVPRLCRAPAGDWDLVGDQRAGYCPRAHHRWRAARPPVVGIHLPGQRSDRCRRRGPGRSVCPGLEEPGSAAARLCRRAAVDRRPGAFSGR